MTIQESERPTKQPISFQDDQSSSGDEQEQSSEGFLSAKNPADAYFLAHGKTNPTSTNLFSEQHQQQLNLPLPLSHFLESFQPKPLQSSQSNWNQWTAELIEGYSILFYGLGSKRVTLNDYLERHLVQSLGWEGIVINGFQEGCDLSGIINQLEQIILDHQSNHNDDQHHQQQQQQQQPSSHQRKSNSLEVLEARAQRLCEQLVLAQDNHHVLLIHNLDGLGFRNPKVQTILGLIIAQPSIHLLATIDHINAPILLPSHIVSARPNYQSDYSSTTFSSSFNFLYHHLSTPTGYVLETLLSATISNVLTPSIFPPTSYQTSKSLSSDLISNGLPTIKATLHVLSSLTEKAKALFRLLAEHQIDRLNALPTTEADQIQRALLLPSQDALRPPSIAISIPKLFELARNQFIASALSQIHALLVEFRDHHIIRSSTLPPSNHSNLQDEQQNGDQEWIWIAFEIDQLEQLLTQLDHL